MKKAKDIIVLTGVGQIGMAIARRMGHGKKIFIADWKLENANATVKTLEEAGFDVVAANSPHNDALANPGFGAIKLFLKKIKNEKIKITNANDG